MKKQSLYLSIVLLLALCVSMPLAHAQQNWSHSATKNHAVDFPDILGYQTFKCDFHSHTVFSDGNVWPTVRLDEALREGLDLLAISDHIEYQPHKDDIPTNHNRPYQIASPGSKPRKVMMPMATEITRDTPPGHFNAIFLNDIDPLEVDGFEDSIKAANDQGAFVFWNHAQWKGVERGKWLDVHTTLYENNWLHGIEVGNGGTYYPIAHQWALDKNLTFLGNSDIHQPSLLTNPDFKNHRTQTLVFAKERTLDSIHEALKDRRTVVWYKDQLIGKEPFLKAIFDECVQLHKPHHQSKDTFWLELSNASDLDFSISKTKDGRPLELNAHTSVILQTTVANAGEGVKEIPISIIVNNLLVAPNTGLSVTATVPLK